MLIAAIKGVSGSGKSTRTYLFLSYLKSIGCTWEDYYYLNSNGLSKNIGVFIPEFNLLTLGKIYETNGFERFQGYDVVTSNFVNSAGLSEFLKSVSSKMNVIVEGAGVTGTHRLRPKFLFEFCGWKKMLVQYYNYEESQKDEYLERIFYRSGKHPRKGTMWDKCSGFNSDHVASEKEKEEIGLENCKVFRDTYDTPEYDLGVKIMLAMGFPEESLMDFIAYCAQSDYLKLNSFGNYGK
jgi:hypothetical protein